MFVYNRIILFIFVCFLFLAGTCIRKDTQYYEVEETRIPVVPKVEKITSEEQSFHENSKITRGVLITHCGSCHQSTLDSHKAAAIRIFDLDKGSQWHTSLLKEHLEGIAIRTKNKDAITQSQKEAIAAFLHMKDLELKE